MLWELYAHMNKAKRKEKSTVTSKKTHHLHDELLSTECNMQWIIYGLICSERFRRQRKHKLVAQPCQGEGKDASAGRSRPEDI